MLATRIMGIADSCSSGRNQENARSSYALGLTLFTEIMSPSDKRALPLTYWHIRSLFYKLVDLN